MTSTLKISNESLKTEDLFITRACCDTQVSTLHQSVDTQSVSSLNESVELKSQVKQIKKKKRSSDEHAFQKMRNYQVFQQAIFIAILNQFFELIVRSPVKRSIVSLQLLRVDVIKILKDVMNINEFVIARCKEKYKMDIEAGILEKTAKRRSDTNRITELLHLLQDILREKGFSFSSKLTDGKNGAQVIETVTSIRGPNGFYLSQTDILRKGETISKYLSNELVGATSLFIPMGDQFLKSTLMG